MIDYDSLLEMFLLGIPVEIFYESSALNNENNIHKKSLMSDLGQSTTVTLYQLEKFTEIMSEYNKTLKIKTADTESIAIKDFLTSLKEKCVEWFEKNLDKKLIEHQNLWKTMEKNRYNIMAMEDFVRIYIEAFSSSPDGKGIKIIVSLQYACFLCDQSL